MTTRTDRRRLYGESLYDQMGQGRRGWERQSHTVQCNAMPNRLKGQTLPLRFGQFKYACWTTSLSTLTLMGVAVLNDLKYTTTLSLDTTKKPKPRIPKQPNQKYQKKTKTKNTKKTQTEKTKKT